MKKTAAVIWSSCFLLVSFILVGCYTADLVRDDEHIKWNGRRLLQQLPEDDEDFDGTSYDDDVEAFSPSGDGSGSGDGEIPIPVPETDEGDTDDGATTDEEREEVEPDESEITDEKPTEPEEPKQEPATEPHEAEEEEASAKPEEGTHAPEESNEIIVETTRQPDEASVPEEPVVTPPKPTERPKPNEVQKYTSIRVCGKEFICLTGTRGPCQPNQVLAPVKEDQGADLSCTHLIGFPWKDCRAAKQVNQGLMTNQPTVGHCVSMETPDEAGNINLCPGYPDSYKFDPVTQSCQPFSNSGKKLIDGCGEDQEWARIGKNAGWCVCKNRRHLAYVGNNRCYHTHTKGPCKDGEWLEPHPTNQHQLHCARCPCPESADGRHYYWDGSLYGKAGCYRSFTTGPCPKGSTFIVDDYIRGIARCHNYWPLSSLLKSNAL